MLLVALGWMMLYQLCAFAGAQGHWPAQQLG